jgi:hypothetical protein
MTFFKSRQVDGWQLEGQYLEGRFCDVVPYFQKQKIALLNKPSTWAEAVQPKAPVTSVAVEQKLITDVKLVVDQECILRISVLAETFIATKNCWK